jgi:hypothetical protein
LSKEISIAYEGTEGHFPTGEESGNLGTIAVGNVTDQVLGPLGNARAWLAAGSAHAHT